MISPFASPSATSLPPESSATMFGTKRCLWRTIRVAVTVLLLASQSEAASNRLPASQGDDYSTSRYRGEVYLLRGFADVFSGGLDQLGADLARTGIPAKVVNHSAWKSVGEKIAANQKKFGRKPYPDWPFARRQQRNQQGAAAQENRRHGDPAGHAGGDRAASGSIERSKSREPLFQVRRVG